jgi:hypothetical protein
MSAAVAMMSDLEFDRPCRPPQRLRWDTILRQWSWHGSSASSYVYHFISQKELYFIREFKLHFHLQMKGLPRPSSLPLDSSCKGRTLKSGGFLISANSENSKRTYGAKFVDHSITFAHFIEFKGFNV